MLDKEILKGRKSVRAENMKFRKDMIIFDSKFLYMKIF